MPATLQTGTHATSSLRNGHERNESAGWRLYRWTREQYHKLATLGFFGPEERLELLNGEILYKMPQNRPHVTGVANTTEVVRHAFGPNYHVQVQAPIVLSTDGEPEPDIAVLPGRPDDYPVTPTQKDVCLLVEVSDTTLEFDRGKKASAYAKAGITDYWVLDVNGRKLEVRRDPAPIANSDMFSDEAIEWVYGNVTVYEETELVSPLHAPNVRIPVREMLPRL